LISGQSQAKYDQAFLFADINVVDAADAHGRFRAS
jgi:hypothetical protein